MSRPRDVPLDLLIIGLAVGFVALTIWTMGSLLETERQHEARIRALEEIRGGQ